MTRRGSEEAYLRALSRECRCCVNCWDVPCPGCLAGSVCDEICHCFDVYHDADEDDERDEEDAW